MTPTAPPTDWTDDLLRDPHAVADKRRRVQRMFAAIAPSYDLNNRLHSLGVDQLWRRRAVKLSNLKPADRVVDVACGTGDLIEAYRQAVNPVREHESPERAATRRSHRAASAAASSPRPIRRAATRDRPATRRLRCAG